MSRPSRKGAFRAAALIALAAASGCSHGARPRPAGPSGAPTCPELPGRAEARSHFVFAVTDEVSPEHAPVPANPSEAVLFALLYETLVDADCSGRLLPGLARSWESDDDERVWTFRLREDVWLAHADRPGKRALDATTVREAWRTTRRNLRRSGELPWPWQAVPLRTVTIIDPERVRITCDESCPELPALLSLPEFAVALRHADEPVDVWPEGTRGVVADPDRAGERDLVWWAEAKDRETDPERITFHIRPGADPRDLAAANADAFLARDARAEEYLRGADGFRVTPLPADVTYWAITNDGEAAVLLTSAVREDLAAHVVLAEARPAPPEGGTAFGTPSGSRPGTGRIHFFARDPDARSIAERLSVLTGAALGPEPASSLFPDARPAGDPVPGERLTRVVGARALPDRVLRNRQLLAVAPWLAAGGWAIPLVEVRAALVTRVGLAGVGAGRDGTPRLVHAGWERGKRP